MVSTIQFVDSIPPDIMVDGFNRTVVTGSGGWGIMDGATNSMRPPWGFEGGTTNSYSVSSGTGRISVFAVNTTYRSLVGIRCVHFDQTVTITVPILTTGGPLFVGMHGLYGDNNNNYKAELSFNTNGSIDISISKIISGVITNLVTASTGLTYTAGNSFKLRFQYLNGNTWRAMAWAAAGSPPTNFMVSTTDTYGLIGPAGRCGPTVFADSTLTNTRPFTVQFDDYTNTPEGGLLLDLMSPPWTVTDAFDISPPALRRAESSTMLRDGSIYPATAYDNRTLGLTLALQSASPDGSGGDLQDLMMILNRENCVLRWQMTGMSKSVYFRTFRSGVTKVDEHPLADPCGTLRGFTMSVAAEPFAYGAQQFSPPMTITNNPIVTGVSRQQFDVAGSDVLGDVETPFVMRINSADVTGQQSLIAMRRDRLAGMFYELQLEDGNPQGDTTEPGHDVTMSGTGNNYAHIPFSADATLQNREAMAQFPPVPFHTTSYRGKYRVLMRYRKSNAGDVITARLLWGGFDTSSAVVGKTVTLVGTTDIRYVDLGLVSLPIGADPMREGYSGLQWPAQGVPMSVQAGRTSGSGSLDIDVLVFVPADDSQLFVSWPSGMTDFAVVDGIAQMAYGQNVETDGKGPGAIGSTLGIPAVGVFPMLTPAVVNRIFLLPNIGTTGSADNLTATATFTISYFPRYLYVRPLTT